MNTPPASSPLTLPTLPFDGLTELIQQRLDLTPASRQRHGDIYALVVAGQTVVVLNHPDQAGYVLQRPHRYPKAYQQNLPMPDDSQRLPQLHLLRPHFHRQQIAKLADLMIEEIAASLQDWALASAEGSPLPDLEQALSDLTLRVLTRVSFGADLPIPDFARITSIMTELQQLVARITYFEELLHSLERQSLSDAFAEICAEQLAHNRQALLAGQVPANLLALLVETMATDAQPGFTPEQLCQELLFIFFVGVDNIAKGLTQSLRLLMAHPTPLATLQTEIATVLGDELPTLASLNQLNYAGMVLQEALRLHPPAPLLMRSAAAADEIAGFPIPAGATVILPIKVYHTDPEFWPNPERFDPERFDRAHSPMRHPHAWLPFGAGPRFCLGKDFALLEGKLILAMVLQRFDFHGEG